MKIKPPSAKIVDRGNVKIGFGPTDLILKRPRGDSQDMKSVKVTLPTAKIVDRGNVKIGFGPTDLILKRPRGNAQDMRSGK